MALPVQEVGAPIILGSIPLILLWYGWRRHLSSLAFLTSFYPLSLLLYLVRDSIPPSVIGFIISSMFLIPAYFDNFEKNLWRLYTLLFTLTFSLTNFDLKVGVFILALGVVLIIKVESPGLIWNIHPLINKPTHITPDFSGLSLPRKPILHHSTPLYNKRRGK